jgi:hypothetical protein
MALIVECATPVSATNNRGPQPVRSRASQTRRSSSVSGRSNVDPFAPVEK